MACAPPGLRLSSSRAWWSSETTSPMLIESSVRNLVRVMVRVRVRVRVGVRVRVRVFLSREITEMCRRNIVSPLRVRVRVGVRVRVRVRVR